MSQFETVTLIVLTIVIGPPTILLSFYVFSQLFEAHRRFIDAWHEED